MRFKDANDIQSIKKVKTKGIHPALVEERKRCDFNQEQIAEVAWGSKLNLQQFRVIRDLLANDPILQNTFHFNDYERDEQMEDGMRKLNRIAKIGKLEVPIDYKTAIVYSGVLNGNVSCPFIFV